MNDNETTTVEPGTEDRAPFGDNEVHPEVVDDHAVEVQARATRNSLPFWISEKFHWKESKTGRSYLSPNPEFLSAIVDDAFKAAEYGITLVTDGSQEKTNVTQLVEELGPVFNTLEAIDPREATDLRRWIGERATRNACYAAITQFELTSWAARSAAGGKNASDHASFGSKESRMEGFAVAAGQFRLVGLKLLGDKVDLSENVYAKMAKRLIFQQADMNTRDQQNPADVDANDQAVIDGAVAGVKRF